MVVAIKLFLHFMLLNIPYTFCYSKDTISVNQTLTEGNILISKQKNFALGFFSPRNSSYRYLGIWYHKISEQTVVWVANRNNPINDSFAVLTINQHGNLILYSDDDRKFAVWSTNVSVEANDTSLVQLLDSGNLVLVQVRTKRVMWQSFDFPTNTMLPGMKIGLDRRTGHDRFLTSWKSPNNPGTGEHSMRINPSGSPQLFLYTGTKSRWRTSPWPWREFSDVQNYSLVNDENEVYFGYHLRDASVILRIVLDDSGLFHRLTWHENDGRWKEYWSAEKDVCNSYGHCGVYGKCDSNSISRFQCACLPGYKPKSPRDWYLRDASAGCVRKRVESSSMCGSGDGFVEVARVKLPDTSAAIWVGVGMSRRDCEKECKRNCSCTAYASTNVPGRGGGCLTWYGELVDTIVDIDDGSDMYVRVDAIELDESARKSNGFLEMKGMLAFLAASVASAWFVIVFACLWLKKRRMRSNNKLNRRLFSFIGGSSRKDNLLANELGGSESHQELEFFNLGTILAATKNFSPDNKLGQGGFGSVFKGQLSNGLEVAVKRLSKESGQGIEEFKNEVMLIAKLQHRNLVRLLGCCIQRGEKMLIYEYLPNKSLDLFLFDQTRELFLDWSKRFNIIVGIARGILYLHHDSRLRIIHRDLKTSNILLDSELNPKISDFGMARIFKSDQVQDKTKRVVGTYGYMSPEYAVFGKFSVKSDVFGFGVMLLEIITGKRSTGFYQGGTSLTLIGHVWELWKEDTALEAVDSSLKGSCPSQEV